MVILKGKVTDEAGRPVVGAHVYCQHLDHGGIGADNPQAYTDENGDYLIIVLAPEKHDIVVASPRGFLLHRDWTYVQLTSSKIVIQNFVLPRTKVVFIDFCYQPNGEPSFENAQEGTIQLRPPQFGFIFSKGVAHNSFEPDDLRLEYRNGVVGFSNFYTGNLNGFYDAGAVSLESVKEAATDGYGNALQPCIVGHVYVVRTWNQHYAKFIVRSVEDAKESDILRP